MCFLDNHGVKLGISLVGGDCTETHNFSCLSMARLLVSFEIFSFYSSNSDLKTSGTDSEFSEFILAE